MNLGLEISSGYIDILVFRFSLYYMQTIFQTIFLPKTLVNTNRMTSAIFLMMPRLDDIIADMQKLIAVLSPIHHPLGPCVVYIQMTI